jgi:hypothetical protein
MADTGHEATVALDKTGEPFSPRWKNGKDCGCYTIKGKFGVYEPAKKAWGFGLNMGLSLTAQKNRFRPTDSRGKPGCECPCTAMKIVQIVSTTAEALTDFKARRTVNDWRIDATEHMEEPFVSDTQWGEGSESHESSLSGGVADNPASFTYSTKFTARTCIVCKAGGDEVGKVLGCVEWGYTAQKINSSTSTVDAHEAGEMTVVSTPPRYLCGDELGETLNDAIKGWDASYTSQGAGVLSIIEHGYHQNLTRKGK